LCFLVRYIIKQYGDATKGLALAEKDFALVDKNCLPEQQIEWKAVMVDAHAKRMAGDTTTMDVYKTESYQGELPVFQKGHIRDLTYMYLSCTRLRDN
jgi:hypothetical protein